MMKKTAWMYALAIFLFAFAGIVLAGEAQQPPAPPHGVYGSFTGTVTNVTYDPWVVMLEDAEGNPTAFTITEGTYHLEGANLDEGARVQMFYELSGIAPAIYPPRYYAAVAAPVIDDAQVFVGQFGENMVSLDGQLMLINIGGAETVTESGAPFEGSLEDRTLIVLYGVSTRSIPAQTTPTRIIALPSRNDPFAPEPPIIVNDQPIGENARINANGILTVPLAPVAHALGFETIAEGPEGVFHIDSMIRLEVGVDEYQVAGTPKISLGDAPEAVDGVVYVPLQFFRDVAGVSNAYFFEGLIVIDNGEPMV